jgi:SAM-dependent methyltransferase
VSGGEKPPTWHHGLVAEYWATFNLGGPEIDYFGQFVERGQPALDAGCGTGRLLLPWLAAGFDVDGCDASTDMVARCRERAERDGYSPTLFVQRLHELAPPRSYGTIVVCGVFGLGSTRAQDEEALSRLHRCLEPGGTLLLDNEVPYANARRWRQWTGEERERLPEEWPPLSKRQLAPDGSEFELRVRAVAVYPLDQAITLEIRAEKWRNDVQLAEETYMLSMRSYFKDELLLLLERAGFADVDVRGGYGGEAPTADHDFLVYIARR